MTTDFPTAPSAYGLEGPSAPVTVEKSPSASHTEILTLPNKDAVLALHKKIRNSNIQPPIIFVVDKDLWVHAPLPASHEFSEIITTNGYSIENDLFMDGSLETLLDEKEKTEFNSELAKFIRWYARSIEKQLNGIDANFRTHPGKILDDPEFYLAETTLKEGEKYPDTLFTEISGNYAELLRGKSLFALLLRQLSSPKRDVKFSGKQLMEFGASRKGGNFQRLRDSVRLALTLSQQ